MDVQVLVYPLLSNHSIELGKESYSVRTSMHSSFLCKGQMFLILFSVDTCLHVVDDLMGLRMTWEMTQVCGNAPLSFLRREAKSDQ
ncbi:hypothetical protein WN944_025877 [Citrus x changshan-huyou]|uniref:Uncharacterized protein n=1 Tax=Citrus x changshan-huyou TaxID=2935761 RepID=A0AAP0LR45_9ROSI